MVPEVGHFALILALLFSIALTVLPMTGSLTGNQLLMHTGRSLSVGLFFFVTVSFGCLIYAFVVDDFSVSYVAGHSNSLLPIYYKVSAVWGGHEGSLLLWALMLASWTLAIAWLSKSLPLALRSQVLSVMGFVSIGFLMFMLFTSNPFDRLLPMPPADGGDLNPLLQDIGLILHPPILYMGYVGFSATFAFAIAALISGRLDSAWTRWARPWANAAWAFLTLGIALGSWWAYYELGWGGWWFWDPVENASFLPWLVGTALIHSMAVTEKRGLFKNWTILLAIFTFALSLLGTFLVRSGVLTSVHAFANDPERGVFILMFLLVVVGGSLALYALRAPVVLGRTEFRWLSREIFLLANNILLIVMMISVLLGTLYPLIADALGWGKISVGPPYFNLFFVPLMGLLCLLMAPGAISNWKKTEWSLLQKLLWKPWVISMVIGLVFPLVYAEGYSWPAALAVFLGSWIITAGIADIIYRLRNSDNWRVGLKRLTLSYYGMQLAHMGIAVCVIGMALNSIYSDLRDLRMAPGEIVTSGRYEFELEGVERVRGPNYMADEAQVRVMVDGKYYRHMYPQKRRYFSGGNIMTQVALDPGVLRDLYIAMGEPLEGEAWAMRVHIKPFVRWIWFGPLMMAIGAGLALTDKRYRKLAKKSTDAADAPRVKA